MKISWLASGIALLLPLAMQAQSTKSVPPGNPESGTFSVQTEPPGAGPHRMMILREMG